MKKTEAAFQTRIKRSFDLYCQNEMCTGIYYKLPDDSIGRKPYDCQFILKGRFIALELKTNKLKHTFNFTEMFRNRIHQVKALSKIRILGHGAWTLIKHGSDAYAIDGIQTEWFHSCGSVKAETFYESAVLLPRARNDFRNELLYDLSPII